MTDMLGAGSRLKQKATGRLVPIKDHVIVEDMKFGERKTTGGVILLDDDGKDQGIRPRWGRVYSVGPEQQDIKEGQWILVEHGRWTRSVEVTDPVDGTVKTLRRVDPSNILGSTDEEPTDETMGIN